VPTACVRHPDRATGLSCTRCGRPACPECLREASVGYQCVDCVGEGRRGVRRGVTIAGAEPGGRPLVTPTLVALNVAVFAWTVATSGSVSRNDRAPLFQDWALVPGAVADGEWWRVITGGFLHFGPIHLLFNMMALWVIGRDIEPALGHARFLAVYLVSLLGGSAAVMLFSPPNALVAGASGAVFGLMGALAVLLRRLKIPLGQVGGLIAVNLAITFLLPGISVAGHLGGLVVGAVATAALVYAPADRRVPVQTAMLGGLTLLLLALIAVRMVTV
jgi:membrane associated rhomboid family serine protease